MNEKMKDITILYEDADCVVINKPAGIMVHSDGRSSGPFLTDWVLEKFPDAKDVGESMMTPEGESVSRPGIVHRLDKDTSGVLLIAKTEQGHAMLKKQFQERTITKKYLAFVWGEFTEEFGTINKPIGRHKIQRKKMAVVQNGRQAITHFKVLKRFDKYTLLECNLETGRTHQIRVHMASIGYPVVGDRLYSKFDNQRSTINNPSMMLHSYKLVFIHPKTKKEIKLEIKMPERFKM